MFIIFMMIMIIMKISYDDCDDIRDQPNDFPFQEVVSRTEEWRWKAMEEQKLDRSKKRSNLCNISKLSNGGNGGTNAWWGFFLAKIQTQCLISKQKLFNISQHSYGGSGEQMLDRSKKLANVQTQCLISKQSFISKQNLCNISQYSNGEEWGEQMLDRQRTCRMVISQHSNSWTNASLAQNVYKN